jgi:hypothetical protein
LWEDLTTKQSNTNELVTEERQRRLEILDIMMKIRDLPSESFGEAWSKQIRKVEDDIRRIWDSLAELTFSSFKELATSFIKDILFGDETKAKINQEISNIRMQIAGIGEERQRSFNQVSQMRRLEGESNDEYLQRTQRLSEIQQQQTDIYTFQTKEMELLQRINELEQERNNIILDRLKNLGQKITDKLLDHGLNLLFAKAFSGGSDTGGGGGGTGGGIRHSGGDERPIGSGGGLVIQFHGDVYGMDDFGQRVDQAVRTYSQRRNA